MPKKKTSYIGYSEEDVTAMENYYFVLQFGNDFMNEDHSYFFTKKEVSKLYNRTLKNLMGVVNNGSDKDRKHAIKLIAGLVVSPMRLH